jgi:hypothetical protein
VTKETEPIEYKIRVTEGSRMHAYQSNMFVMEFSAPGRVEPLRVELFQSEQYEISSPNPITVDGFEKGARKGIFVIRPSNAGTITLNFKIGNIVKTHYASALTENPYVFGEPIKDEHLFFGRVAELSKIHRGVTKRNKQNFLIVGARRAGKTSLLFQLNTRLQYPFVSLLLTPEKIGYEHYQMFRSILLHLREEVQESLGEEPPPLSWDVKVASHETPIDLFNFHFERDFKKHLAWLAKMSDEARVILLLDEATFLLADSSPEKATHDSRQQFLRHLLQSYERIACVLAGTPQILKMTGVTSPLYNIFSGIKLKGFSPEETEMLIREPARQVNVSFDNDAAAKIIEYGGCSPYYTQALCSLSLEHMYDTTPMPIAPGDELEVTVPHVDAAICRIIDAIDYGLQSVWSGLEPDERGILKRMAASESVMVDQHNRDVIARLADMNLATVNESTQFAGIKARLDEVWIRQQGV